MNSSVTAAVRRLSLVALLLVGGCYQLVPVPVGPPPVPAPIPPPLPPPLPPPEPPPPPPLPPDPPPLPPDPIPNPPSIQEILAKIVVGMIPSEVEAAVGSKPIPIPHEPGLPYVVRWNVTLDGKPGVIWVRFSTSHVVEDRGYTPVLVVEGGA